MLSRDSEDENLLKICVWTCDMTSRSYFGKMNSTLGSVVPLAMFFFLISTMRLMTWTWGRCRGWAQGGRGGGGAEGSITSRGVVVPRQGQALLLALAKRFLNNAQVLESDALKSTRKQATWMHGEGEKRRKSDDNDYTDDKYAEWWYDDHHL